MHTEKIRKPASGDTEGIAERGIGVNSFLIAIDQPPIIAVADSQRRRRFDCLPGAPEQIAAFSNASQEVSINSRCCGSMLTASRGETPKEFCVELVYSFNETHHAGCSSCPACRDQRS